MSKDTKRGYVPKDKEEFSSIWLEKLHRAAEELKYLLERGYAIKGATTFIGNHYMLSERQRLALMRAVSSNEDIGLRASKRLIWKDLNESTVHIDAFNTIITLEVALSESLLVHSMDSAIRDLAGLRGTYRIIENTYLAAQLIFQQLDKFGVKKVVFYLDAPVSNSGRLKILLLEEARTHKVEAEAIVINDVDKTLEKLSHVITSDAIILNKCISWFNLNAEILKESIPSAWYVSFH